MIMADVLKIFLLVLGAMLTAVAHGLVAAALFPEAVERWNVKIRRRPVLSSAVGALVGGPLFVAAIGLFGRGAEVPGLVLLGVPTAFGLLGVSALSLQIGRGLGPGSAASVGGAVARGGTVLALVLLLPFFGWFVLLPWVLALGIGAQILCLFDRRLRPASA